MGYIKFSFRLVLNVSKQILYLPIKYQLMVLKNIH